MAIDLKPTKAIWAAVLGFLAPAASILLLEVGGNGIQMSDVWKALLVAIVTAGSTGGAVYSATNKPVAP